ncbi:unnamed protein product [Cylicostephanus goldi]|uniref:Uncharacterized protein n=1 Tax=Cylicostephanus goldi TaxID=71465 RepID=A0A3P7MEB5_CYLGO|nr:unnamed protein product [Cylicostephanus goldi]
MGKFNYTQQVSMLPDTIPFISVPKTVADQIASNVGAKLVNGSYEIGCHVTIPNLEFSTEKAKYSISSDLLVVKVTTSMFPCQK